jgi:hypothetical protein
MPYTTERANLIAGQLERLATYNAHELAGQLPNLEFWLAEATHALAVIEDYPQRFARLHDAQVRWVDSHGTRVTFGYCNYCGGPCCSDPVKPAAPRRISSSEIDAARRAVRDGVYHLLLRLLRAGWIDEARVRAGCDQVGTSVDLNDLDAIHRD